MHFAPSAAQCQLSQSERDFLHFQLVRKCTEKWGDSFELFSYEAITHIINDISFSMLFLIMMEHVRALSTLTGLNDPGQLHFWPSPCPGAHIFVPYKLSVWSSLSPWADIRSTRLQLSWPWPCTPYPWPEDLSYNHKLFLWWCGLSWTWLSSQVCPSLGLETDPGWDGPAWLWPSWLPITKGAAGLCCIPTDFSFLICSYSLYLECHLGFSVISLSSFTEYLQTSELTYVLLLTGHLTFLLAEVSEQVGDPGMNSTGKIFFFSVWIEHYT